MDESDSQWKLHKLGYGEFLEIFSDEIPSDGKDWPILGLTLKADGIWVTPDNEICPDPNELATFYKHPDCDLSKPALSFPCDFYNANRFFRWCNYLGGLQITGLENDWNTKYEEWQSWQEETPNTSASILNQPNNERPPRTRTDTIAAILNEIWNEMHLKGETISASTVMQNLIKHPDLDPLTSNQGVIWVDGNGKNQTLTISSLNGRLSRIKAKLNR